MPRLSTEGYEPLGTMVPGTDTTAARNPASGEARNPQAPLKDQRETKNWNESVNSCHYRQCMNTKLA